MTTPSLHLRGGFIAAILAFFFTTSLLQAADTTPPGILAFGVQIPAGKLTAQEVHDIVIVASVKRAWIVKEDSLEKVVIYLNHRKNEATITYLISDSSVQAYCEGYATNGKGVRKGPAQPEGWLKYLKTDLTKELNLAAYTTKK